MHRHSSKQQTRPTLLKRKRHVAEEVTESSEDTGHVEQDRRRSRIEACADDFGTRSSSSCSDEITVSSVVEECASNSKVEDPATDMQRTSWSEYRHQSCLLTPTKERPIPLPLLAWADRRYVWDLMFRKDEMSICERDEDMIQRHPHIEARMRSILLDWLVEVCEVYNLHRETYHLSVDYIDRFLSIQKNVQKQRLQLIGVTCLFIAAKVEEIYPPKILEFAFVTDGACTENEIMTMELSILKTLNWKLTPITANSWLNTFMQVSWSGKNRRRGVLKTNEEFLMPKYSGIAYAQTAQLVDLSMLDIGCLQFSYSVIATSAIYHMFNKELALFVSGFEWNDIAACIQWMAPFATTVRDASSTSIYRPVIEQSPGGARPTLSLSPGEEYKLQVHNIDLTMLDAAQNRMRQATSVEASPIKETVSPDVLTPPSSRSKKTATDEASVSMTESFV